MSKYRSTRVVVDGITFHSKLEAKRYGELKLLQRAGKIRELKLQPRFKLDVNGTHICNYLADFQYLEDGKGIVVEDVKGFATQVYRLKAKLFSAIYHIPITEVRS